MGSNVVGNNVGTIGLKVGLNVGNKVGGSFVGSEVFYRTKNEENDELEKDKSEEDVSKAH